MKSRETTHLHVSWWYCENDQFGCVSESAFSIETFFHGRDSIPRQHHSGVQCTQKLGSTRLKTQTFQKLSLCKKPEVGQEIAMLVCVTELPGILSFEFVPFRFIGIDFFRMLFKRKVLVSWCFELSHQQRILLGLKTNFNLSLTYSAYKSLNQTIR